MTTRRPRARRGARTVLARTVLARTVLARTVLARTVLARCDEAREAVSARFDGEPPGVPLRAIDEHLAACRTCTAFEHELARLKRRTSLAVATRPGPPGMAAAVASAHRAVSPADAASHLGRVAMTSRRAARRAGRWSAAMVPAVVLAVALPLGAGAPSRHAATHPPPVCSPRVLVW